MASDRRHILGRYGEEMASAYLQSIGYQEVERNYRSRSGEIDLVMLDQGAWVFIEVKTRNSKTHEAGLVAIDQTKLAKIRRTIADYLQARSITAGRIRLEALSVLVSSGQVTFDHLKALV